MSVDVIFNEFEMYYKSKTSFAKTSLEKDATNLEFVRLVEFIPVHEPEITSVDSSANAHEQDGEDAGQMNPSPEEEDEQLEVEDSQDNVESGS